MTTPKDTRGTAACADCLFGRAVVIADTKKKTEAEMCECHVARPTRAGFPVVRLDDFCGCHVDAETKTRTFAGLAGYGVINY